MVAYTFRTALDVKTPQGVKRKSIYYPYVRPSADYVLGVLQ